MTTLPDRPNSCLLVIDVQNAVVANAHERDAVIANISSLIDRAREGNTPRSSGSSTLMSIWSEGVTPGSTCPSWSAMNPNPWCTKRSETRSREPISKRYWRSREWAT